MTVAELLKLQAGDAFKELLGSIEGLTEQQSWGTVQLLPGEYMHSEGSILSIVLHVAGGKFLYGSCAYRDLEVRWRDVVSRIESFWPSWDAAKDYLIESHEYWLGTWSEQDDFSRPVKRFDDKPLLSWQNISIVTAHDNYHAGQIHYHRAIVAPSEQPPPEEIHLWRKYCEPLPSW